MVGKQRRPCSEYVAAAMSRASALGATDEMHHLPLLQRLLTGTVTEAKADRYEMHHPFVVAGVVLCRMTGFCFFYLLHSNASAHGLDSIFV